MARRSRRQKAAPRKRGRKGPTTEYVIGTDSDLRYAERSRQRLGQQARRRWVIRLAILAIIVFVCWMWGPDVVRRIRRQGETTAEDFRGAGRRLRAARDERSGVNFDENAPVRPRPPGEAADME